MGAWAARHVGAGKHVRHARLRGGRVLVAGRQAGTSCRELLHAVPSGGSVFRWRHPQRLFPQQGHLTAGNQLHEKRV